MIIYKLIVYLLNNNRIHKFKYVYLTGTLSDINRALTKS